PTTCNPARNRTGREDTAPGDTPWHHQARWVEPDHAVADSEISFVASPAGVRIPPRALTHSGGSVVCAGRQMTPRVSLVGVAGLRVANHEVTAWPTPSTASSPRHRTLTAD